MTDKQDKESYLGNPNLKGINVPVEFTEEQIAEYLHCSQDPVYFIKNFVKIVNLNDGLVPFELYDFQEKFVKIMHDNRFVISKFPRQSGKCVYSDTKVRVRNKNTGEIKEIPVETFYKSLKSSDK